MRLKCCGSSPNAPRAVVRRVELEDTDGASFYVVQRDSSAEGGRCGNQCNRPALSDVTVDPAEIVRGQAVFSELLRGFRADTWGADIPAHLVGPQGQRWQKKVTRKFGAARTGK